MPPVIQEIVPMTRGVFTQQEITKFLIRSEDDIVGIEDDITYGGMDGVVDGGTDHPRIVCHEQGNDGMLQSIDREHYENTENTVEGGGVVSQPDCQFRRGYCTKHKIKGTKTVTNTKKWTKKNHGYGWSTIRKVTFTCNSRMVTTELPILSVSLTEGQSPGRISAKQQQQGVQFQDMISGMSGIMSESLECRDYSSAIQCRADQLHTSHH